VTIIQYFLNSTIYVQTQFTAIIQCCDHDEYVSGLYIYRAGMQCRSSRWKTHLHQLVPVLGDIHVSVHGSGHDDSGYPLSSQTTGTIINIKNRS